MITHLELEARPHVLALDLGLRFGWACYRDDGVIVAYGSHHCGQRAKLKSIAWSALRSLPEESMLYIEGGGELLEAWLKIARRRSIETVVRSAEDWRQDCLIPRDQRSGEVAKRRAVEIARGLIRARAGQAPTSLRHDAAEATLFGWWALYQREWVTPAEFKEGLRL